MRTAFAVFALVGGLSSAHAAADLDAALSAARESCVGISEELNQMKTMAGIGTAVSAAGTVAGGAAVATGVMKANVDEQNKKDISIQAAWAKFKGGTKIELSEDVKQLFLKDMEAWAAKNQKLAKELQELRQNSALGQKSEKLGDVRTGALAAATLTNTAGAVVGGMNMKKAKGTLTERVAECLASVKELSNVYGQVRVTGGATPVELDKVNNIISACDEWSTVDLSKIDTRATGATVSSAAGAAFGLAGTVTSAMSNTDKMRYSGRQKEENLNKASNALAGTATVASGAATIFNATQLSALKRASTVADACEGALK